MDYKFFKKINKAAKEKGATPVEVKDFDRTGNSLVVEINEENCVNLLGIEFMDMLMIQSRYYVINPNILRESELLTGYEIKRRLQLHCSLEHDYYYY